MKISLVFIDWREKGRSIYSTEQGNLLSMGDFHSGTTFDGEIELQGPEEEEFKDALKRGFQPCFLVEPANDKG